MGTFIRTVFCYLFSCGHDGFCRSHVEIESKQKQNSRGILRKRCSENMQQIYRRTHLPKGDFNKVALQFLIKSDFNMN